MAIIQCPKCLHAIQYHGIPDGTEFVAVTVHDWKIILASSFDPSHKKMHEDTGHPYLYRSDTIETDFPGVLHKGWKCPECNSILFFGAGGHLVAAYEKDEAPDVSTTDNNEPATAYMVFDDYTWDALTEAAIPNRMISKSFKETGKAYVLSDQSVCTYAADNGDIFTYRSIELTRELPK